MTYSEAERNSSVNRTILFCVIRISKDGVEVVTIDEMVNFPTSISDAGELLVKASLSFSAAHPDRSGIVPSCLCDPSKLYYFDWELNQLPGDSRLAAVPTPGIVIAAYEEQPFALPDAFVTPHISPDGLKAGSRRFAVSQGKWHLSQLSRVKDFFLFPESRVVPARKGSIDVFLSYTADDKELALELRDGLKIEGLNVFLAELSIDLGSRWERELLRAMQDSSLVVLLITPTSIKSSWVTFEAGAAWALELPIAPALLQVDHAELPAAIPSYHSRRFGTTAQRQTFYKEVAYLLRKPG